MRMNEFFLKTTFTLQTGHKVKILLKNKYGMIFLYVSSSMQCENFAQLRISTIAATLM